MKSKRLSFFACLLACGAAIPALNACGDDGKIHVSFWHTMGQANQALLDRMIVQFNEIYPDVKIDHSSQGDYISIHEKLQSAIPAGTMPTMAFCYPDHVADYLDSKAVINLDDYLNDPELGYTDEDGLVSDYVQSYWQEGQSYTLSGTYSVPYAKSTEVLFYNKTFFEKYNLSLPQTWEEMWALCKNIKENIMDKGLEPDLQFPLGYDSDSNLFITLCEQRGIGYTTNDNVSKASDHILFNSPEAKAMVEELNGYAKKGWFATKNMLGSNAYTSTYFTELKTVMSIGSTGGTSYQVSSNFEVAVARVPTTGATGASSKIISQGPSICFFKKGTAEQKTAAWNFYKFITRAFNTAAYGVLTGYEPVRRSSFTLPQYEEYIAGDSLQARVSRVTATIQEDQYLFSPVFVGSAVAREEVGNILVNYYKGLKTLDQAFADAYARTIEGTKK